MKDAKCLQRDGGAAGVGWVQVSDQDRTGELLAFCLKKSCWCVCVLKLAADLALNQPSV